MNRAWWLGLALAGRLALPAGAVGPEKGLMTVETAFDADCETLVLRHLKAAKKEIRAAVYTFAKKSYADALIERAKRGVDVRLKLDAREAEFEYTQTLIKDLRAAKVQVELITMSRSARMHHKFAVIDAQVVLTGSFNWTRQANDENWENVVAIENPGIARQFREEWDKISAKR
jgi:phosphatidylserine/phosphatidylglycerophosphate/cardiolipin synthase-like enzyme